MAVSALSYQLARVPKVRRAERRQGSVPTSANIRFAPGPAAATAGPNGRQGRSEAVRPGGTIFFFFSLRPRVAPHFTSQIGSRNMTSVSSSSSTELGYGVSALEPAEPRETTEHPLALRYLVQAARQLRPAARPLRTASAVAGQ
jgi:hypothetical protein